MITITARFKGGSTGEGTTLLTLLPVFTCPPMRAFFCLTFWEISDLIRFS
jgi:hypothetical protein